MEKGTAFPACLPDPSYKPDKKGKDKRCVVSGWGTIKSQGSSPDILRWVDVGMWTNQDCSSKMSFYPESNICAGNQVDGDPGEGKDSCQGDSGGPLVCKENGNAIITGVVSYGNGCGNPQSPGVYARVTYFLDWIKKHMVTISIKSSLEKCKMRNNF